MYGLIYGYGGIAFINGAYTQNNIALDNCYYVSADGGFGHLALSIADDILWQIDIPIPSESRLFTEHIPVSRFYERGRPIAFHLHNHGLNHWRLVRLAVQ